MQLALFQTVWVPMKYVGEKNSEVVLEDRSGALHHYEKDLLRHRLAGTVMPANGVFLCPGGWSNDPFCRSTQ